ncbi:MAG TPA: hypothetical protein VK731_04980 [Candidatus Cybelea sp.]|jgi:hypothetical protein|nr:hypothetical protein [Candidatus Cybelea sp.]
MKILLLSSVLAFLPIPYGQAPPPAASGLSVANGWINASSTSANNVAVTVAPTAGHLLVVGVASDTAVASSISDNIGSTTGWTSIGNNHTTGGSYASMWYKKNIPSGMTTITVTATGGGFVDACVMEVSGASTTTPFTSGEFATYTSGATSTANPQVGPVDNATANSIFFALLTDADGSNPTTMNINGTGTVGTWNLKSIAAGYGGLSQELNCSLYQPLSMTYIIVSSSANHTHGWTTTSSPAAAVIADFHP